METKPSEKQTKEEEKPTPEDYRSTEELDRNEMNAKEFFRRGRLTGHRSRERAYDLFLFLLHSDTSSAVIETIIAP
jgi:hypothetical protein